MRNENVCCKAKENRRRRRAISAPYARCWDSLECISDLCSAPLMAISLIRVCTSEPTSPHVDELRKVYRKLKLFHLTASARGFPTWRAAYSRLELAKGLTMVMSSRSALYLHRCWLSKSAPPLLRPCVYNDSYCTLLSRRDRTINSAWCSTRLWARELHPVFVQDMAWRRVVSRRQPLPWYIPPSSATPCDPRLLPKVSLGRGSSILSSCETPGIPQMPWRPFSTLPGTLP